MSDQPETKPCLEDGTENPIDAATCSACGGSSFQHVLDQEVEHREIERLRAEHGAEEVDSWLAGSGSAKYSQPGVTDWLDRGRPDFDKDEPSTAVDPSQVAPQPARSPDEIPPPAETAPSLTDEPSQPRMVSITPLAIEVLKRIEALEATGVVADDALLEKVTAEVKAERAKQEDSIPTQPETLLGVGGPVPADVPSGPTAHDGDEPLPAVLDPQTVTKKRADGEVETRDNQIVTPSDVADVSSVLGADFAKGETAPSAPTKKGTSTRVRGAK